MKILVLNCGSSSIKYALYNMDDKSVMTSGGAERVGLDEAFVKVKMPDGTKKKTNAEKRCIKKMCAEKKRVERKKGVERKRGAEKSNER